MILPTLKLSPIKKKKKRINFITHNKKKANV